MKAHKYYDKNIEFGKFRNAIKHEESLFFYFEKGEQINQRFLEVADEMRK